MSNVIVFKTKATAQDEALFKLRWHCELLGVAQISGAAPELANHLFNIRFSGAIHDKTVYSTAINPSVAVALWSLEQHAVCCEKEGDHAKAKELRAAMIITEERRRKMETFSDRGWSRVLANIQMQAQA